MSKLLLVALVTVMFSAGDSRPAPRRGDDFSGCCSWHGGVLACMKDGTLMCMDGTVSGSCRCW